MATRNDRYGWHWDDAERECRKDAVRRVRHQADKPAEQVRRVKVHLPAFADPAERVLRAVTAGLGGLTDLDITNRGPKYHRLSPEEADRLLEAAPGVFRLWVAFASAPEFGVAVREANQHIQRANVQARQEHDELNAIARARWEWMRPVYELLERGDHQGALRYAAENGLL
jgi:hypothetical protein